MTPDANDELGRARARRAQDRPASRSDPADEAGGSTEQEDALARARESWALSRLRRAGDGPTDEHDAAPSDTHEEI